MQHPDITLADLDAALSATPQAHGTQVSAVRHLPDSGADLLEAVAKMDPRGPLATINGLLEALRVRHSGDEATQAILAAVQHLHLPTLVDNLTEHTTAGVTDAPPNRV